MTPATNAASNGSKGIPGNMRTSFPNNHAYLQITNSPYIYFNGGSGNGFHHHKEAAHPYYYP